MKRVAVLLGAALATASTATVVERLTTVNEGKQPYQFDFLYDDTLKYKTVSAQFLGSNSHKYIYTDSSGVVVRTIDSENFGTVSTEVIKPFSDGCAVTLGYSYIPYLPYEDATDYEKIVYACVTGSNSRDAGPFLNTVNLTIEGQQFSFVQNVAWLSGDEYFIVADYNVHYVNIVDAKVVPLTTDGAEDYIHYGSNDWMNGVFDSMFVQDGVLFVSRASQEMVTTFEFQVYNEPSKLYPPMAEMKYPNPGTNNPTWEVMCFSVAQDGSSYNSSSLTNPMTPAGEPQGYIQQVLGGGEGSEWITILWKNRWSNESSLVKYSLPADKTQIAIMDTVGVEVVSFQNPVGWVGVTNNQEALYLNPMARTEQTYIYTNRPLDGFNHLYKIPVNTENGEQPSWLTSGNYEVSDMNHFAPIACVPDDDSQGWIYYYATLNGTDGLVYPNMRFLWRKNFDSSTEECLTCDLDRCSDISVTTSFRGSCKTQIWNCGGTGNSIPYSLWYDADASTPIQILENNDDTVARLESIAFREKVYYYNVSIPEVGPENFNYHIHYPPNFDANKKYPLFIWVYGGPGTQWVTDEFKNEWSNEYLASTYDIVVASMDSYGTPGRGTDFLYKVYKQLGIYEPHDQIAFAKHLATKFDFIDSDRMGVWGRSYGGFVTSRIMSEDSEAVFKCGMIVAPVTDWSFYQTLYTERAMLSPELNPEGYANSVSWQKPENYKKHQVHMVHGTHDENVHFQNSAVLEHWLVENGVEFDAYFAADENHRFTRTANGNQHHYKMLTRFLDECLHFTTVN